MARLRLVVLVLTLGLLAGCAGESTAERAAQRSGTTPADDLAPVALSRLRSVLLDAEDVGEDFVRDDRHDWFEDTDDLGCLMLLERQWGTAKPVRSTSRRLIADTEYGYPSIREVVAEYESAAAAKGVLTSYARQMRACSHARFDDEYGGRYDLEIWINEVKDGDAVEQQVNLTATGWVRYEDDPEKYDSGTWFSTMRIGRFLVTTTYDDGYIDAGAQVTQLNQALAERLAALTAGDEIPPVDPLDLPASEFEGGGDTQEA